MTRVSLGLFLSCCILLAGCATGTPSSPRPVAAGINGEVHGGQQPVSGATIQLYAAGASSDGSAATPLVASAVATDANGGFSITGLYQCPSASSLVYLVATGGNPGLTAGTNPQLGLMTALGPCGNLSASTFISVNELTTVAAVYSLAPYATSFSAIGSGSSDLTALAAAFNLATQLVNTTTGTTPGLSIPSGFTVPVAQLDTVADILATCINSSGGTSGDTSSCGQFFALTLPTGNPPATNALNALLNLAKNPALNTPALYNMATPTGPYQPSDTTQPPDLSVNLQVVTILTLTNPLNFPSTGLLSSSSNNATITNSGAIPATIAGISISGPNASQFNQSNNCLGTLAPLASCTFQVNFAPTVPGSSLATLNVISNAVSSPNTAALSGSAPYPNINLSPSLLILPPSPIGTPSGSQSSVLMNSGVGTITINSISFTGANPTQFSQTNNCPTLLAAGNSCTITVTDTPAATGNISATLDVGYDGTPAAITLPVSGVGYNPAGAPTLLLSTPELYVPSPGGGYLDLTNVGSVPIVFSSISLTQPSQYPAAFTEADNCGTLAPGAVCVVSITTSAANFQGLYSTLTITSNATNSVQTVTVAGGSITYNFGSAVVGTTGAITNPIPCVIDVPVCFITAQTSIADFTGSGGSCGVHLPSTCSVTLGFSPTALGFRLGTLTSNGATAALLVGFGTPTNSQNTLSAVPTSLTFPQTALGTVSATQTVTVSNPAGHLLNFVPNLYAVGAAAAQYRITPATCASVSCTVSVAFAPNVVQNGTTTGYLQVIDSVTNQSLLVQASGVAGIPQISFNPSQLNFGTIAVGAASASQTFSISSIGDSPAYIEIYLPVGPTNGTIGSDFYGYGAIATVSAGTPYTTNPYTFFPSAPGNRTATVTVTDSRSGLVLGTYTLNGTGSNAVAGTLVLSTHALLYTGTTTQSLTVTNNGTAAINVPSISITGGFTETDNCVPSIASHVTCTIKVTAPNVAGASGSVSLNDGDTTDNQTVSLFTSAGNDNVILSTNTLAFTSPSTQSFTLKNYGYTTAAITAINLPAGYTETDNCVPSLAAQATCTVNVTVPNWTGPSLSSILTVIDGDSADNQTVTLTYPPVYAYGAVVVNNQEIGTFLQTVNSFTATLTGSSSYSFYATRTQTQSCTSTGYCYLQVLFSNGNVLGPVYALLTYSVNGGPNQYGILYAQSILFGAAEARLSDGLSFGTAVTAHATTANSISFYVDNYGSTTLSIPGISAFSSYSPTAIPTSTTCPATLPPSGECTVTFTYTQPNVGPDQIHVAYTDPSSGVTFDSYAYISVVTP